MTRIFISYRRDETADVCGRLYDRLEAQFGHQNVFKDVDSIPAGDDFRESLDKALADCDVVLALIGSRWVGVANSQGQTRLAAPNDFVRIEVEAALQLSKPIVPVLVGAATPMPEERLLPPSIAKLAYLNASRLRPDPDFRHDCDMLIASISRYAPPAPVYPAYTPTYAAPAASVVTYAPFTQPAARLAPGALRWVIGGLGLLASATFIVNEVFLVVTQCDKPATCTNYHLLNYIGPLSAVALDVLGSLLALGVIIWTRRWWWIIALLALNVLPFGFAPSAFAFWNPKQRWR